MIVSASRRTDIPAQYADWFFNRLDAGRVLVRNPANPRLIHQVSLSAGAVDGIVFWTKNPAPMIGRLDALKDYACLFHVTVNAYGHDMEPGVPSKRDTVIPALCRLSRLIGPERVIWRYDPVLLNHVYTLEHHCHYFAVLARRLAPFVRTCVFSFLDRYPKTSRILNRFGVRSPSVTEQAQLAGAFAAAARPLGLSLRACCEPLDLSVWGIAPARCIDAAALGCLSGHGLHRNTRQRPGCHCAPSVDIGAYDTCRQGCRYCYANTGVPVGAAVHNPLSPLLLGEPGPQDTLIELPPSSGLAVSESGSLL